VDAGSLEENASSEQPGIGSESIRTDALATRKSDVITSRPHRGRDFFMRAVFAGAAAIASLRMKSRG
jgi:hypothetical protein